MKIKLKKRKLAEYIPSRAYRVEEVNPRRRKPCACGKVPEDKRLLIQSGSGRWSKTEVFCRVCGVEKLDKVSAVIGELKHNLRGGESIVEASK